MKNYRTVYPDKVAPVVASRKIEYPFTFATVEEMIAVAGENAIGFANKKMIVRIPADMPLPEGAAESDEAVSGWNKPVNNHALRCKFADWKRKAAIAD